MVIFAWQRERKICVAQIMNDPCLEQLTITFMFYLFTFLLFYVDNPGFEPPTSRSNT